MRMYMVGIDKIYFPVARPSRRWSRSREVTFLFEPPVKVKAESRTEAAKLAWEVYGETWLEEMGPCITGATKRKISLYVNEPSAGVGGILGRLSPIQVYEEDI